MRDARACTKRELRCIALVAASFIAPGVLLVSCGPTQDLTERDAIEEVPRSVVGPEDALRGQRRDDPERSRESQIAYWLAVEALKLDGPHERQALERLRSLCAEGNLEACCRLGEFHLAQNPVESTEAARWFTHAANRGHAQSMYSLGEIQLQRTLYDSSEPNPLYDFDEGLRNVVRSHELGYAKASHNLGHWYVYGWHVEQDYSKAIEYLHAASDAGVLDSTAMLGNLYWQGLGVVKDQERGLALARRAAERGNAFGASVIGYAYRRGEGVEQDTEQAIYWLERAAYGGNVEAMFSLHRMFSASDPTEENRAKADWWLACYRNPSLVDTVPDEVRGQMAPP